MMPYEINDLLDKFEKDIQYDKVDEIVEYVYQENNETLLSQEIIDTKFSGSSCLSVIFTPKKLITINVGGCKALLGKLIKGSK